MNVDKVARQTFVKKCERSGYGPSLTAMDRIEHEPVMVELEGARDHDGAPGKVRSMVLPIRRFETRRAIGSELATASNSTDWPSKNPLGTTKTRRSVANSWISMSPTWGGSALTIMSTRLPSKDSR